LFDLATQMTELLYYTDSYQVDFQARVVERLKDGGRAGVILDRTCFYPTSGGQPFDRGEIDGAEVEEVLVREEDGAVIHWLAGEPRSDDVTGRVEWPRRFDHMQQHTGQHILSQAFERVAGAATVSFHMGDEASTLDLDVSQLTPEQVAQGEMLANTIVWEDRPVAVQFVTPEQALQMPLRKIPPAKNGLLRLVSIESFDLSACGGTHVRRCGEVGQIKVTKSERQGGNVRLEFLCGRRALEDYERKNAVLARLSAEMTTGYWEIGNSVARLQADLKQANRALKSRTEELVRFEARDLARSASAVGGVHIVAQAFANRDPGELRRLASHLAAGPRTVVLIGLAGAKAQLLFARSEDLALPLNELLREMLPLLGEATGGGSPKFAQGGGPAASEAELKRVLESAESWVRERLGPVSA
jgi:alanyl-tRNA synthetase